MDRPAQAPLGSGYRRVLPLRPDPGRVLPPTPCLHPLRSHVALGRKNGLFAGSDAGGKTAATLMSLCMTCRNLAIDSFAYLRDVLERISTHPARRIGELLPDQWKKERAAAQPNPVE